MKKIIAIFIILFGGIGAASAQVGIKGHFRSSGKYVAPHYRSQPNKTQIDNWSSKGNFNPYTGRKGTKDPYGIKSFKK